MPTEQDNEDTFLSKSFFKVLELFWRYEPMKPSVTYNHATIFSTKRIDNKICYQDPYVNNKQSRDGFYCLGMNQKSTQDKCCVFGKERNSDSSENQEDK